MFVFILIEGVCMGLLGLALFFFIVAIIAGLFGFTGIAAGSETIARFLMFVFLALVVIFIVLFATGVSLFS